MGPFARLGQDLQDLHQLAALWGEAVGLLGAGSGPVTAVALEGDAQGWRVENSTSSADGWFLLRVRARQRYRLVVFGDPGATRRVDPSRPLGVVDGWLATPADGAPPRRIGLQPGGWNALDAQTRAVLQRLPLVPMQPLPVAIGEVTNLRAPMFDHAAATLGLWAPHEFLTSVGGGVFLLQPFVRQRTAVLLVHGAAGSPRDFAALASGLDTARIQPWVFHYPSGLRLDAAARMLSGILVELARRLDIARLCVVAHSMGGLVSMAALQLLREAAPAVRVPLLATISTPWGGHEAAAWGVRLAPTTVPSWIDMQVDSAFQQRLREAGVPRGTRHHLYFSYRGRGDDGTVSIASQLQPTVQAAADRVRGLDEDHTSVLGSALLIEDLDRSLRKV